MPRMHCCSIHRSNISSDSVPSLMYAKEINLSTLSLDEKLDLQSIKCGVNVLVNIVIHVCDISAIYSK